MPPPDELPSMTLMARPLFALSRPVPLTLRIWPPIAGVENDARLVLPVGLTAADELDTLRIVPVYAPALMFTALAPV